MIVEPSKKSANPFKLTALPSGIGRWIPAVSTLQTYQRGWLGKDIVAGVVLTAILVPVGMGYAEAAGLPAIYGLYATIVPLIAYAVFGPSRVLVLGPDSSLAAIIAATIIPLSGSDMDLRVALAGMLALLTGTLCILAGLARFGFVTDLLSKPIRLGYLNGIALTVIVSQLPKILGFPSSGDGLIEQALSLVDGVAAGMTNPVSFLIGLSCLAIVFIFKRKWPKVPGVLIAVLLSTIVVGVLQPFGHCRCVRGGTAAARTAGISDTRRSPWPTWDLSSPVQSRSPLSPLRTRACCRAPLRCAAVMRSMRIRRSSRWERQMSRRGLFQGFSISSSSSRTPVAESAGAKSQLTGVVGAICIALLLVFAPTLLQNLPNAALGAIVIAACISLVDVNGVSTLVALGSRRILPSPLSAF